MVRNPKLVSSHDGCWRKYIDSLGPIHTAEIEPRLKRDYRGHILFDNEAIALIEFETEKDKVFFMLRWS